ncbi:Nitrate transporter [Talaromyces islandicus]|uniref:Nitrate transporter n=1 Tax=Talaromyces islandicus TaxID=28573 RepID=A0A0U1M2E4_TALIS|nr:Nitrate transporter [Talaromyces islandicus]
MANNAFTRLFAAPEINPLTYKALSVPILNPFNQYGRVFLFSWLGFFVAFLSWFAFPPLLTDTIKKDLKMTQADVANSNIVALLATLLVRFISGPLCDRFGPRWVFIGLLLSGSIPTAMAGLVTTPAGLIALRFFVGILGASFVPCQVWTTGFFDKSVVGSANALTAGLGNAGGGVTYFAIPAVYNSLVARGLTEHKAWRVTYIVPFIIIVAIALCMIFTCEDTPTGKWSERHLNGAVTPLTVVGRPELGSPEMIPSGIATPNSIMKAEAKVQGTPDPEAQVDSSKGQVLQELVVAPTWSETMKVVFSGPTLSLAMLYACTFGAELALDAILGSYYSKNFSSLGQTKSGEWAAMFGLLNVVFRPLGGYIADIIYRRSNSLWGKKIWLSFLSIVTGAFLLAIGLCNPKSESAMFGLVAGMAFFLEAANGANFALVPHVYPFANGIVSGTVGASGNFGGIIFNIIFRYNGTRYDRSVWIMGVICLGCDKTKPVCKRCTQTGYQCEGYGEERSFVYVIPTRTPQSHDLPRSQAPNSIHSGAANRVQILSYFLEHYLPNRPLNQREDQTALTWIRSLPASLGKWNFLDMALSALSLAYIGDMHQKQSLLRQGERCYDSALIHMRARLSQKWVDEGVLAACMYGGTQGWMFHVKGACWLLKLRGPPSEKSPLDMNLYRRIRAAALWDSYGSGKPTFLAKPEWRGLSDAPYDRLLDILVRLPSLLAKADQIDSTTVPESLDISTVQRLLKKCHALRDELIFWYAEFQSKEASPLFYLEPEEQHPYLEPGSDLQDVFPESVKFQSAYIAQMLLLYWYGEVVVHSVMSHMHRHIREKLQNTTIKSEDTVADSQQQQRPHDTIADVETVGDYFASKVCQAMAGCGRNPLQGYGFQIAMVPLWAAQQFFLTRSTRKYIWCQTVLVNFGTKGFVLAQSLGSLPLRQYPGRYVGTPSSTDEIV